MSDTFELKRKEDIENLSKIPILIVKFEEFSKRFDIFENYVKSELRSVNEKIDRLETLRERIVQVETESENLSGRIKYIEDKVDSSLKSSNEFLKRISLELAFTLVGVIITLVVTFLRR
ncbi:MAG: hypothetical protein QXS37_04790 [Candidatus Aenigmatarchaeota archaeon]